MNRAKNTRVQANHRATGANFWTGAPLRDVSLTHAYSDFLSSLFATGVMASSNLQAQATIVDAPDTIFVALDTLVEGGAVEAHWDIANDSEVALELMVTRMFLDTVSPFNYPYSSGEPGAFEPGAFERFCWGPTCFNYGTDSSPSNAAFLVTLQPGQPPTLSGAIITPILWLEVRRCNTAFILWANL